MSSRKLRFLAVVPCLLSLSVEARADEPSPVAPTVNPAASPTVPAGPASTDTPAAAPPAPSAAKGEVEPPKATQRTTSLDPKAATAPSRGRTTFDIDPIADSAMIAVSLGFAGTLELINSTGEIRPQQIAADFNPNSLIWIDRSAAKRTPDPHAGTYSTIGLGAAVAFAFIDPVLSGVRENSLQTGLADAFMYSEALSFTLGMTNVVKMAVRRPRPIAYIEAAKHPGDTAYANSSTDSALSFFSGHSAITATVGATATYLAFARSPHTARPWITLLASVGLTTFVSIERVRAGRHFPTDVIAGSVIGAGIGLAVPHLHRSEDIKQRRIWVGFTPLDNAEVGQGGLLNANGIF
jgi:membrane-associated phospholipid phosphatase